MRCNSDTVISVKKSFMKVVSRNKSRCPRLSGLENNLPAILLQGLVKHFLGGIEPELNQQPSLVYDLYEFAEIGEVVFAFTQLPDV